MKLSKTDSKIGEVYKRIRHIIEEARGQIARAVNTAMVIAYWQIGQEIVENEQQGKSRAGYSRKLLQQLSEIFDSFT
jgi:hypothetical protein